MSYLWEVEINGQMKTTTAVKVKTAVFDCLRDYGSDQVQVRARKVTDAKKVAGWLAKMPEGYQEYYKQTGIQIKKKRWVKS